MGALVHVGYRKPCDLPHIGGSQLAITPLALDTIP